MRSWWLSGLVVVALVAGVSPAMADAAGWSLEGAPNEPQQNGHLEGVSCSSSSWCVAVGTYTDPSNLVAALIETWNGTAWTIVPVPDPPGVQAVLLNGVSCTAATACVAVGFSERAGNFAAIAERWDGSSWTMEPMPAGVSELFGVSCSSRNACTAVGLNQAVRWDGTSWTTQTLPAPPNHDPNGFLSMGGVSCASPTACTAVGLYNPSTGAAIQPVAEHWDGVSWTVDATPLPSGDGGGELVAVSCSSPDACTAVGEAFTNANSSSTLALRWDGTSWTVQPTPNAAAANPNMLLGVSCAAEKACVAVGNDGLAAHWDGTTWSLDANPQPTLDQTQLTGVSCASTTSCTAVGEPGHTQPTMAEHWDGTVWTVQATPPAIGARDSTLEAVSCAFASSCTAVGFFFLSDTGDEPLAEHWDGSSWTLQSVPVDPAGVNLDGVSCSSSSACTAVGVKNPPVRDLRFNTPTAERWNGTSWTSQPIPLPPGAQGATLQSVSCPSASSCTAVGASASASGTKTALVAGWDGASWTVRSAPSPNGASQSELSGVSCASTTACTAVGDINVGVAGGSVPLAERWDGQKWTIQPTLNPPGSVSSVLNGVSCPGTSACTAVGSTAGTMSTNPLVERWNGAVWTIQAAPSGSASFSVLSAVSCASTPCAATGNYTDASGHTHPLAERWDGTAWTIQPTPEPADTGYAQLDGVSCASTTTCQAVGGAVNIGNGRVVLAEGYG